MIDIKEKIILMINKINFKKKSSEMLQLKKILLILTIFLFHSAFSQKKYTFFIDDNKVNLKSGFFEGGEPVRCPYRSQFTIRSEKKVILGIEEFSDYDSFIKVQKILLEKYEKILCETLNRIGSGCGDSHIDYEFDNKIGGSCTIIFFFRNFMYSFPLYNYEELTFDIEDGEYMVYLEAYDKVYFQKKIIIEGGKELEIKLINEKDNFSEYFSRLNKCDFTFDETKLNDFDLMMLEKWIYNYEITDEHLFIIHDIIHDSKDYRKVLFEIVDKVSQSDEGISLIINTKEGFVSWCKLQTPQLKINKSKTWVDDVGSTIDGKKWVFDYYKKTFVIDEFSSLD